MILNKFLAATAMVLSVSAAYAQEATGEQEYLAACAGCHGESGMGDGPLASLLNIETPSLTTLAVNNDGKFPFLETLMIVDGRTGVRGHGGDMMPIWGDRFSTTARDLAGVYGSETIVRGRLLSLVYYLETIQE